MLYKLFKYIYAPTLMKKWVRAAVVIIFFGWLCSSLAVVNKIEVRLRNKDQSKLILLIQTLF